MGSHLARGEEKLKWFPEASDASSEEITGFVLLRRQGVTRQCIVHDDAAACRKRCDEVEGSAKGRVREIQDNAEPCEDGWRSKVKATIRQLMGEALTLEIYRHEMQVSGLGQSIREQKLSLPLLGRRVIDLKHLKARVWVAMGKGIEARTEKNVLPDSLMNCIGEFVFGVAVAGDEPGAHREGRSVVDGSCGFLQQRTIDFAQNEDGDGIVEYKRRRVVDLMRCPADGNA